MLLGHLRALPVARELILDPSDSLQSCLNLLVIGAVGVAALPNGVLPCVAVHETPFRGPPESFQVAIAVHLSLRDLEHL